MSFGRAETYLAICDSCAKRIQRAAWNESLAKDFMKEQGWHITPHRALCHPCFMTERAHRHPAWVQWVRDGNDPKAVVAFWTTVVEELK